MTSKISILLFVILFVSVDTLSAQSGKDKKTDDPGIQMNKSENRLTTKSTEETQKGIQVDTKSMEEIINNAAVCKYAFKLKNSAILKEHGVCWGKNIQPTVADSKTASTELKEGVINGNMEGLEPNTKYYVRAYVSTTGGTFYGKELSFVTVSGEIKSEYWYLIRRR